MPFFSARSISAFLFVLYLAIFPQVVTAQQPSDTTVSVATFAFSDDQIETRISDDLNYLASDEREGRGPYTQGLQAAAEYVAEQFRDAGLKTKLIEEGPFQVFAKRTYYDLGEVNKLAFTVDGENAKLLSSDDYRTLSPSISGKFDLPVAFAGYGISSETDEYDDSTPTSTRSERWSSFCGTNLTRQGRPVSLQAVVIRRSPIYLPRSKTPSNMEPLAC